MVAPAVPRTTRNSRGLRRMEESTGNVSNSRGSSAAGRDNPLDTPSSTSERPVAPIGQGRQPPSATEVRDRIENAGAAPGGLDAVTRQAITEAVADVMLRMGTPAWPNSMRTWQAAPGLPGSECTSRTPSQAPCGWSWRRRRSTVAGFS